MTRLLLSILTGLLLLTACSATNNTLQRNISGRDQASYVESKNLSEKDSTHILEGRLYPGMPIEHAIAALGKPLNVDTSSWNGKTQTKLTYRARPKRTQGYMKRAYVYAVNDTVTNWKDLDQIPRFKAYYEIGN